MFFKSRNYFSISFQTFAVAYCCTFCTTNTSILIEMFSWFEKIWEISQSKKIYLAEKNFLVPSVRMVILIWENGFQNKNNFLETYPFRSASQLIFNRNHNFNNLSSSLERPRLQSDCLSLLAQYYWFHSWLLSPCPTGLWITKCWARIWQSKVHSASQSDLLWHQSLTLANSACCFPPTWSPWSECSTNSSEKNETKKNDHKNELGYHWTIYISKA